MLDVPFDEGVMSSTAAQMRCDSVAYEATRLQAQERGINHRGLPSVNNFSSYLSNGFEAYDVPSAPRDLIAASPAALTSAAFLNFSVPLTDNNNRIREYEIGWQNAEAGKAASDSGVQMMQPAQMPSLVVRNLTNAESYSLRARAHNRAVPWRDQHAHPTRRCARVGVMNVVRSLHRDFGIVVAGCFDAHVAAEVLGLTADEIAEQPPPSSRRG